MGTEAGRGEDPATRNADDLWGRVIFLVGASGSGKTVVGERAARLTNWTFFDTDAYILKETGVRDISAIFDEYGEGYFRRQEVACIEAVSQMSGSVLVATGGGLPAIPGLMARLNRIGISVYLKASLDTLWKRLAMDPQLLENRPLLRSGGKAALAGMLDGRGDIYAQATMVLDTDRFSVDEVCGLLVAQIMSIQGDTMMEGD